MAFLVKKLICKNLSTIHIILKNILHDLLSFVKFAISKRFSNRKRFANITILEVGLYRQQPYPYDGAVFTAMSISANAGNPCYLTVYSFGLGLRDFYNVFPTVHFPYRIAIFQTIRLSHLQIHDSVHYKKSLLPMRLNTLQSVKCYSSHYNGWED